MPYSSRRPEKKLRGISRRMRSLSKWAAQFKKNFPSEKELLSSGSYWNWKLPTHQSMVEGRYSTPQLKQGVAQALLEACANLMEAKPNWAAYCRVTCIICLPDMFSSEVCIYLDEEYFRSHVAEGVNPQGVRSERIAGRSLASEWNLMLVGGMAEVGLQIEFPGYADGTDAFQGEQWIYGDVDGYHSSLAPRP